MENKKDKEEWKKYFMDSLDDLKVVIGTRKAERRKRNRRKKQRVGRRWGD